MKSSTLKSRSRSGMTVTEKLKTIEALWESLTPGDVPVPAWHRAILAERKSAVEAGTARFISFTDMKQEIAKLTRKS